MRTHDVLERCLNQGFALAGVGSLEPSIYGDRYCSWIDAGRHGSMSYLSRNVESRLHPSTAMAGARCAVIVADIYAGRAGPRAQIECRSGRVARYAQGSDYHKVIKKRLHTICDELRDEYPHHEHRAFVDTAPVLERELAQRAGLGWIGKHTLLINPVHGSRFFLGGFFTTLDLVPAQPEKQITDHCGSCTRCIDACPTDAISPYSVDASRCISYLTIERRDRIPKELSRSLSGWIFGCDICMDVCPHNSTNGLGRHQLWSSDAYAPRRAALDCAEVLQWTEEDRLGAVAGSAMTRANLGMLKRNAMLNLAADASTNSTTLREELRRISGSEREPDLARTTARDILAELSEID